MILFQIFFQYPSLLIPINLVATNKIVQEHSSLAILPTCLTFAPKRLVEFLHFRCSKLTCFSLPCSPVVRHLQFPQRSPHASALETPPCSTYSHVSNSYSINICYVLKHHAYCIGFTLTTFHISHYDVLRARPSCSQLFLSPHVSLTQCSSLFFLLKNILKWIIITSLNPSFVVFYHILSCQHATFFSLCFIGSLQLNECFLFVPLSPPCSGAPLPRSPLFPAFYSIPILITKAIDFTKPLIFFSYSQITKVTSTLQNQIKFHVLSKISLFHFFTNKNSLIHSQIPLFIQSAHIN